MNPYLIIFFSTEPNQAPETTPCSSPFFISSSPTLVSSQFFKMARPTLSGASHLERSAK